MCCSREMTLREYIDRIPEPHLIRKEYSQIKEAILKLRGALANLIGASTPKDLDEIETVLRQTPAPEADKITALDAIHVLRETYPIELYELKGKEDA